MFTCLDAYVYLFIIIALDEGMLPFISVRKTLSGQVMCDNV